MMTDSSTIPNAIVSEPKKRLRLNSFGAKLFSVIMGGAILSITGVTFLFSETVKLQAEEQIQKIIESKVGTIREITDRAETLADSLGISVATLHVRRAETPETYQELTRRLFEEHPDYIVGLGFGQKENGILPSQKWFYPYYQEQRSRLNVTTKTTDNATELESTQATSGAESTDPRYINRALEPYFYPDIEAYRTYFLPQKDLWTAPYQSSEEGTSDSSDLLLTYYSQIFDNANEWIGTAVVDIDGAYLNEIIDEPIYRQQGNLILVSEDGKIIANPANSENIDGQTYVDFPGLTEIWSQINAEANTQAVGLIEGKSGYWSYSRVPEQSWLVVAYVPYWAMFEKIVWTALAAVLPAGLLMAALTALVVRYLNRRLRPVIDECQRLSSVNGIPDISTKGKDELEQLSTSFFNLLEQFKLSSTKLSPTQLHSSGQPRYSQQATTGQLIELLPPEVTPLEVDQQLSPQKLQRELLHLKEAVSSLAEDSRLSTAGSKSLDSRYLGQQTSSSASSEITSVQDRLNQIFPQILAVLNQFSHLLSAFNQTQDCTLLIQDVMLTASQDIETQTNVVNKLQQCAIHFQPLSEVANPPVKRTQRKTQPELTTHPAFHTLRSISKEMSEQLALLSEAAEDTHRKTKEHQSIASVAQVLIVNASTLAISASRPQSAETHEKIVTQLRSKETALKALAEQMETAQLEQQQSSTSVKAIASEIGTVFSTLDRSMQQLESAVQSMLNDDASRKDTSQPASLDRQAIATRRQLTQQIQALHQNLQQMKRLTDDMSDYIASTLQQTRQIGSIRADVSLAIGPGKV